MSDDPLQAALRTLPHGAGFRFIDRLTALDGGRSGSAVYHVRGDEFFLEGHFPGHPIMPGVILIEALAQLAGVVAQSDPERPPLRDLRLTAVRQAKILGAAHPGQSLVIEAKIAGRLGGLVQAEGTIRLADAMDHLLLSASLVLSGESADVAESPAASPAVPGG